MASFMDQARELEKLLGRPASIPTPEPISTPLARCTRKDVWPPEVWAEMQAIWKGEDQ